MNPWKDKYFAFIFVLSLQIWRSEPNNLFSQIMSRRHVNNIGNLKVAYKQSTNKQCEGREFTALCPGDIQTPETCEEHGCCWRHTNSMCYVSNGMLRLHDGVSPTSGRLEIFHDGQWGTVCNDGWNQNTAKVACFQMGLHNSRPVTGKDLYNTISSGPIVLDNLECSGEESSILECGHSSLGDNDCEHGEDVGLMCESIHSEGTVRLVGGPDVSSGRVEIYYNGRFGTVCDDSWDHFSADVVCRQLGYDSGWPVGGSFFGPGIGTIWLDEIYCSGAESDINSCRHEPIGYHDCTHSEDAGVICGAATEMIFKEGEVRLVGSSNRTGMVEIYHAGSWGRICSKNWSDKEADIVCRQLGFITGTVSNEIYSSADKTTDGWLSELSCEGMETKLHFCSHGLWDHNDCSNEIYNAVQCDDSVEEILELEGYPPVIEGIRLVGSNSLHKGRVEVSIKGRYGTVCDDGFDQNAAAVVCRSLGYVSGVTQPNKNFGSAEGPIYLDDVYCTGDELRLEECSHRVWGTHDCSHKEDVAVMCQIGDY